MSYLIDFEGEEKLDTHRKIVFICSGAIDFSESIQVELRKVPTEGFEEIHPGILFHKMWLPHARMTMTHNFLACLSYFYHPFDHKNHPEYKVYYRCFRNWHHSHDIMHEYDIHKPMTIDEAMDYVKKEEFDLVPNYANSPFVDFKYQ
jgi:hypothetical protein